MDFSPATLVMLFQGIGFVWGAAKMHAVVQNLTKATEKLEKAITDLSKEQADHHTRIIILEDWRDRAEGVFHRHKMLDA